MHPPAGSRAIRDDTVTGPIDTEALGKKIRQGVIFLTEVLQDWHKRPSRQLPKSGTLLLGANENRPAQWATLYKGRTRGEVILATLIGEDTAFYAMKKTNSPFYTRVTPEVLGERFQGEVNDLALIAMHLLK